MTENTGKVDQIPQQKIKKKKKMSLYISTRILIQFTILDLFLSMLSIMRWIVFVRKLTGFINLTLCIQKAWIQSFFILLSRLAYNLFVPINTFF